MILRMTNLKLHLNDIRGYFYDRHTALKDTTFGSIAHVFAHHSISSSSTVSVDIITSTVPLNVFVLFRLIAVL